MAKKLFALVMALCMLLSMAQALAEDSLCGYGEPITIKVGRATTDIAYYGGETVTDNSWTQLYADNGILLDVIYDVDSTQGGTKLATSIMSGDYPDIISTSPSDYVNYANGAAIADTTDLVDQYASDELKEYVYSDGGNALECLKINGRIYGLPKISSTYGSASLLFIRKDWLDNLSLEIPTTMEEIKAVAHAFTYDDPDRNGQNDTYGFAFSGVDVVCSGWGDVSLFFDAFGAHIGNGFCSRHLPRFEILHKQSLFRIAPQRTVQKVSGADGIAFYPVGRKLHGKGLSKSDAAEFCTGICEILVGAFKSRF